MNFKSIKFLYIIIFSLYFVETVSAENSEKQKKITINHPGFKISELAGRNYSRTGNEVDISEIALGIEKSIQPYQDIFSFVDTDLKEQIKEVYITPMCQKAENPPLCIQNTRQKLQTAINDIGEKLSREGVYYPEGYEPLGSPLGKAKSYFKDFKDNLPDECTQLCGSPDLPIVLFNGTEKEYTQIYNIIEKKDENCQKSILAKIEKELHKLEFPERCLQEKNKTHIVCKTMLKHIQTIQHRVFELTELTYGFEALKQSSVTFCLECKFRKRINSNIDFIELLKHLDDQVQCKDLKPGQQKIVHPDTDPSLSRPYVLKKEMDGSHSIPLNLRFSPEGYDGPIQDREEIHKYYLNKVQECIHKEANPKLLGPNGEKLNLIIKGPQEKKNQTCENDDTIDISIKSQKYRSGSRDYASDIVFSCPTITHEVLHLLGLCDEYKEKVKGHYVDPKTGKKVSPSKIGTYNSPSAHYDFKPAYDCRIIRRNSVMAGQKERWDNVEAGINHSLLTEDQFKAILYGSCKEKNKRFNECSKLAYQSSIDHPDCLEKKRQCEKELKDKK